MEDKNRVTEEKIKNQEDKKENDNKEEKPEETGGPKGLEPTRYGDWEIGGRCFDF